MMDVIVQRSGFVEHGAGDASRAAPLQRSKLYVSGVDASYADSTQQGTLTIRSNGNVVYSRHFVGSFQIDFRNAFGLPGDLDATLSPAGLFNVIGYEQ